MKRILFYGLVATQIILVLVFTFIFENIEKNGTEITILTEKIQYDEGSAWDLLGMAYLEYEIGHIPMNKLQTNINNYNYNDKVYVVLEENAAGIYEVKEIESKKITSTNDKEVVLLAEVDYLDNSGASNNELHVRYDFHRIKNIEQYGNFKSNEQLKVTLYVTKYGQFKITSIEIYED